MISPGHSPSLANHPTIPCQLAMMISILLGLEAHSVRSVGVLVRLGYQDLVRRVGKEECSWTFVVGAEEVDRLVFLLAPDGTLLDLDEVDEVEVRIHLVGIWMTTLSS